MVGVIPEALVEETWHEVGSLSPTQAREQMNRVAQSQPDLLAFVLGATGDLRTEAQEVAVYLFVVIHRMFEKTTGRIKPASSKAIDAAYVRNEAFLERLEGAHPRFLERAAGSVTSSQRFVMKYLVEALMEAPEGDDPVTFSEEETGLLFLVLKTVVDILDEAAQPPARPRDAPA